MKTYVHHDQEGNIKGVIGLNGPDNAGLMLTPKEGLLVAEVKDIEFKSTTVTREDLEKMVKDYKIPVPKPYSIGKKG